MDVRRRTKRGKGSRGAQQRTRGGDLSQRVISHPPPIQNLAVTHGVRVRFTALAAFAGNITFQNLLDTLVVATTTTTLADLFHAVKIRAIELWAEAAIGTPAFVSLIFDSGAAGFIGDHKEHTDTSMGVQPAHLFVRPSPRSLASDFQVSSANQAFWLQCPAGAVIDLMLTYQQYMGVGVVAQNVAVAATVGAAYVRGLDGKTIALTNFPPTAVSQI